MRIARFATYTACSFLGQMLLACGLGLLLGLLLGGCAAVGPDTTQSITGQRSINSPLNTASMVDGDDGKSTWSATSAGPVDGVVQDSQGTSAWSSGQVTRTVTFARPDGTSVAIRSGSDIAASGVEVYDPATGKTIAKVATFNTSSSVPLDALSRNVALYVEVWKAMSADQRAAIEAQTTAFLEAVRAVSPDAFRALTLILGGVGVP